MGYRSMVHAFRQAEEQLKQDTQDFVSIEYWSEHGIARVNHMVQLSDIPEQIEMNSPFCSLTIWFE